MLTKRNLVINIAGIAFLLSHLFIYKHAYAGYCVVPMMDAYFNFEGGPSRMDQFICGIDAAELHDEAWGHMDHL